MDDNSLESRRTRHAHLSGAISAIDSVGLDRLLDSSKSSLGWGMNQTIEVGGQPVFVKRIPITGLELENPYSTRNLYGMPCFYNYGIGSAGFGVFRELAANVKTTEWVLGGEIETFPLLYHHRIRRVPGEPRTRDLERFAQYIDYWAGDENISRYIADRETADHELVLFLEYIPDVLQPWLKEHSARAVEMVDQLISTIDFLRYKGIIHFDAHFHNILVDNDRPYLTDFGLVLDRSFDLSEHELAFFDANTHYDYGEAVSCLGPMVTSVYDDLPESEKARLNAEYPIENPPPGVERAAVICDYALDMQARGLLPLDAAFVNLVGKYRRVSDLMHDFYLTLRDNPKKDTRFPHEELKRRLVEAGLCLTAEGLAHSEA